MGWREAGRAPGIGLGGGGKLLSMFATVLLPVMPGVADDRDVNRRGRLFIEVRADAVANDGARQTKLCGLLRLSRVGLEPGEVIGDLRTQDSATFDIHTTILAEEERIGFHRERWIYRFAVRQDANAKR